MPRRPSGADKKQKPAKKQGGRGRSRTHGGSHGGSFGRSTPNSRLFAANQHCQTLGTLESSTKTIDGSLPGRRSAGVLDENYGSPQCQKMVRMGDLMGAHPGCCRHPRRRVTQYSSGPELEPRVRSVLDSPPSRGMTTDLPSSGSPQSSTCPTSCLSPRPSPPPAALRGPA
jgi:hypothetical protein